MDEDPGVLQARQAVGQVVRSLAKPFGSSFAAIEERTSAHRDPHGPAGAEATSQPQFLVREGDGFVLPSE